MDIISMLINLIIVGLIFWLVLWFVDYVGVPEPINKIIKVVVGLVVFLFCLNLLLGLGGSGAFFNHPLIIRR